MACPVRNLTILLPTALTACAPSSARVGASSQPPTDAAVVDAGAVEDGAPNAVPDPTGWRATGSMKTARAAHTATLLPDGAVLVVGGETIQRDMIASAEIFDPVSETWSETEALSGPRSNHVAVLLADGRVLVAGGGRSAPIGQPSSVDVTASCLLFDPQSKRFSPTGALLTARSHFRAVRLDTGEVLAVGGGAATTHANCNGMPDCGPIADPLASAERFDPKTGQWRPAAPMRHARFSFTLTPLADGRVMAVGGISATAMPITSVRTAEIYDPKADTWSDAADLPAPDREHHSAILLESGRLMIAGGKQANIGMIRVVDLYAPDVNAWTDTSPLSSVRTMPNLVRLSSGHVLAVGGFDQPTSEDIAESVIYAEDTGSWTTIGALADGRATQTTTLLKSGAVVTAGGFAQSTGAETATCEMTQ